MSEDDDPRKEVPVTAELIETVLSMPRRREWTWADLREIPDDGPGESVIVDVPFPVELWPADLAGPRRGS